MHALVNPMVWLWGLMLAPHSLALLGNLAGKLQWLLPVVLAGGVGIYWLNSKSWRDLNAAAGSSNSMDALRHEQGGLPAAILYYGGRWVTTVAASTVLLVTAGFVFNETFVYWFPNFAFAFVLLGLVMSTHLLGPAAAQRLQLVFITLALTGIGVLTLMGLAGSPPSVSQDGGGMAGMTVRSLFAVLMLFVGFDLAANDQTNPGSLGSKPIIAGLLVAGVTFALWGTVSMQYVPAPKLADTFIAHTLAARAVGGHLGRMLMGIVIIAGTYAAVNALFWNQARSLSRLTARWKGTSPVMRWVRHRAAGSLLSGVIVAVMMATGMAGTDEIDTYVRSGLYLWLLYYAGVHLAVLLRRRREQGGVRSAGFRASLAGCVLMTGSSAVLIATDPQRALVLKTALAVLVLLTALMMTGRVWRRRAMVKGNKY